MPAGITAVRVLYDKYPASRPSVVYEPPISEKQLEDIADGSWYFHAQFRNAQGWGAISHFGFQIDTQPPELFSIKFVDGKETDNPYPTILFDTIDLLSGIDYYRVKIGEGDFFFVTSEQTVKDNPYTLPLQGPGKHTIWIQALDKAGNPKTATEEFIINPIESPTFTEYPQELESGEILIAKGKTHPSSRVSVWLQEGKDEPKSQTVKSDASGNFIFVSEEGLAAGVYKMWAEVTDARGAKSEPSDKIVIAISQKMFLKIGSWVVNLLTVIIPLIALFVLSLFLIWYAYKKFSSFRNKLRKEVREAEKTLHKAFELLRKDIREQIKLLEKARTKRQLTEEEEKIINHLKKDLDEAEAVVGKEIEDLEKVVK